MGEDFNPRDHIRQLRGRGGGSDDYLDVKHRIAWFRSEYPEGHIETYSVSLTDQIAVFKCEAAKIADGQIVGRSTGHGSETPADFRDYIEKAETKAIGRALANLGYGTQFIPEDGERIVDAPVERIVRNVSVTRSQPPQRTEPPGVIDQDELDLGDAILAGFLTSIEHARTEKELDAIGRQIKHSRLSPADRESLKDPYTRKLTAFHATA